MAKQANSRSWGLFTHSDGTRRSYPQSTIIDAALRDASNVGNASVDVNGTSSGLPLIFSDDFESGSLNHTENGISYASRTGVDVSTNNKNGGTRSCRFTFPGSGAGGDAWAELRVDLGAVYSEIKFEWDQYIPNGAEIYGGASFVIRSESPSNNKQLRVWRGNKGDGQDGYSSFYNKVGCSTDQGSIAMMLAEYGNNGGGMGPVGSTGSGPQAPIINNYFTAADRGTWVKFGFYAKKCTTSNNGIIRLYKNDALVGESTNLQFLPSNSGNAGFDFAYILGYANSGFASTTYIFVDNLKIYGAA